MPSLLTHSTCILCKCLRVSVNTCQLCVVSKMHKICTCMNAFLVACPAASSLICLFPLDTLFFSLQQHVKAKNAGLSTCMLLAMLPLLSAWAFWIASGDSLVKTCKHMCATQTQHGTESMNIHLSVVHARFSQFMACSGASCGAYNTFYFCAWYICSFTLKIVACMRQNLNRKCLYKIDLIYKSCLH